MPRYIDGDAFLAYIANEYFTFDRRTTVPEVMDLLSQYPAADVQPVAHAHWEYRYDTGIYQTEFLCSRCKGLIETHSCTIDEVEYEHCPHCGATMDELDELNMLERYLIDHDIPYERKDSDGMLAGVWHQICVPVSDPREKDWDAICHPGSYGYEEGKLEIMGTIVPSTAGDPVIGNLTADEVIKLIEKVE